MPEKVPPVLQGAGAVGRAERGWCPGGREMPVETKGRLDCAGRQDSMRKLTRHRDAWANRDPAPAPSPGGAPGGHGVPRVLSLGQVTLDVALTRRGTRVSWRLTPLTTPQSPC